MRITTIPLLQRLRQCPLGCLESLHVKLMDHRSIMAVLVAKDGFLRIKWAQNTSDYGRVLGASQLCMLRWKVYFGQPLV